MNILKIKETIRNRLAEVTVKSACFLGEGDSCAAYLINDEWIFRFAKHIEARASLRREFCLLPKLAAKITLEIPVPRYCYLEDEEAEKNFIAYRILKGHTIPPDVYSQYNEKCKSRIAGQIANFLKQLHSFDGSEVKKCGVRKNDYFSQYSHLQIQAGKYLFPLLVSKEIDFIENSLENYLKATDNFEFQPCLIHGDFSHDHILYDEKINRISSVIDFGDMTIGDPAWDFLWLYEDYGLDFLSRLLTVYCEDQRQALLLRTRNYSILQAIEWAADSLEKKQ